MKINVFKMQILMGERGLTIKKLAELSGVSRQTISCIISGKGCTPQVAYKIARGRMESRIYRSLSADRKDKLLSGFTGVWRVTGQN